MTAPSAACCLLLAAAPAFALNPDDIAPMTGNPLPPGMEDRTFLDDATQRLRTVWYSRHRTTENNRNEIIANVLGVGLDWESSRSRRGFGADLAVHANISFDKGKGWSEVRYHDLADNSESSSVALGKAALSWRASADGEGAQWRAGYTPISIGTLGTGGGLHSHAYRGVETRYRIGGLELGYGWADQFHNEWDTRYRPLTNSWTQGRDGQGSNVQQIDYAHSLGLRYSAGELNFIDAGIGEGEGYRRNAQLAATYEWRLGDKESLRLSAYGLTGRYLSAKSGIANPRREWHADMAVEWRHGDWRWFAGIARTRAQDSGEMNFRLTPWGNSDSRNFVLTAGQLDDFVWDGARALKLSARLDLARLTGVNGLRASLTHLRGGKLNNPDGSQGKAREWDASLEYTRESGKLKGLTVGVYPARYRVDHFQRKQDRNDIKLIASWSLDL